ncbi:TPA: hypothetical protein ACN1NA_001469 [Enterococcus faecalis]|uniref:hypothetical protein n=1 Tax=Enterococcus TaxID=1350 RepID=UPI001925418E|nr:hypothetical protein [Enterococcus faecalis]EGO7841273.1 hypothetical protein [Enterococcus faecalis]MDN3163154.1 hypothetical protein [Enterococcus faecalis]
MKHRKQWLVGILIILIIGIGGAMYMNEKEKAELHEIQTDLANYLYNNYRIYTFDEQERAQLEKKYNKGNGELSYREYSNKLDEIAKYSDIKKVEFTSFAVGPMKGLEVEFIINDVYEDNTTLSTISAETGKFRYSLDPGNTRNNYVLEEKEQPTSVTMPKNKIMYYEGGIK